MQISFNTEINMIKNADVHAIVLSSSVLLTHLYHGDRSTSHFHASAKRKKNLLRDMTKTEGTYMSVSVSLDTG